MLENFMPPDFYIYCKGLVSKRVKYWRKDWQKDQWNRIGSLIFNKGAYAVSLCCILVLNTIVYTGLKLILHHILYTWNLHKSFSKINKNMFDCLYLQSLPTWTINSNRYFLKEVILLASRHMKRCFNRMTHEGIQIETTIRYYYTLAI